MTTLNAYAGRAGATMRLTALSALVLPYVISGVFKLLDFTGARAEVAGLTGIGVPDVVTALTLAVIATQLGGSALLLAGRRGATLGGLSLAGFTLIATFLAHTWWQVPPGPGREHAFIGFWEHIALVGALAYASLTLPSEGRP